MYVWHTYHNKTWEESSGWSTWPITATLMGTAYWSRHIFQRDHISFTSGQLQFQNLNRWVRLSRSSKHVKIASIETLLTGWFGGFSLMDFIHSFISTTNWGARKTNVFLKLCLLASLEQNNVLMRVVWSLSVFMNKMIFQKHVKPCQLWRPHYSFLPILSKVIPWSMVITSLLNWGIN